MNGNLVEVRSVLDFGAIPNDEDRATARRNSKAIQKALDVLKSQRGGLLFFPEGTYVIDRPLVIEKDPDSLHPGSVGEYNNWLHLVGTGAIIKKAKSFGGDRLLTMNAYSGDKEDSIIIEGLVFNGVDSEVNGIDFFDQHVPYDARHPTCPAEYGFPANPEAADYRKPSAGTKHVNIVNCIFSFCYIGARVWGNTQTFARCQFRGNVCGAFIPTWGNDIRFVTCSFRVGAVGVDICSGVGPGPSAIECGEALGANRQDDKGAASIGFQHCIFEDNLASGIRSKGGNYISIHGGYFEQNGRDYEDGTRRYRNLENQADYHLNEGAAIHKEAGSSGHGTLHIYGTYFANQQKLLANSLRNCFVDCTGGLIVCPEHHCLLGPTFLHGAVDVNIESADDAVDGDSFILNDSKKIVLTSADDGYIDAGTA